MKELTVFTHDRYICILYVNFLKLYLATLNDSSFFIHNVANDFSNL